MNRRILLVCLLLTATVTSAQQQGSQLTVDFIMRGPGLYGWAPQDVRWSGDGQKVYFRWKKHDEPLNAEFSTYTVNRNGTQLKKLTEEEANQAPPLNGEETRDWKLTVYSEKGDLYIYDHLAGRRHPLTKTRDIEAHPRFTQDEKRIAFVRDRNLYVLSPSDGLVEQMTDIRTADAKDTDEDGKKGTDSQEILKKEERELLITVRERAAKREEEEAKRKKENPRKPFRLASGQSIADLMLSPDETFVLAAIEEKPSDSKIAVVPNFVTESAYTVEIPTRTNVGDRQESTKLAKLDVRTGEVLWIDHGRKSALITHILWSPDGSRLAMAVRSFDNKDAWILAVDPKSGTCRELVALHDDAWIDGPAPEVLGWLRDSRRLYFTAEKDGWSHLYTVDYDSGQQKQLTSGAWEVRGVELSTDGSNFLLTTSEVHPGEEHLYQMSIDGGPRRRLTAMAGGHRAVISPDGKAIATVYSYSNKPWDLYIQENGKSVRVTHAPSPDFDRLTWIDPPIVEIPARDGVKVPARMYKPQNWRAGGPLVVFVHGAGYLQNVHRMWSNYAREFMFHHLLMQRGYLVLDVDYRGSAGYGRDWRTAIYRHMGGQDLNDQIDAVRWAVSTQGVDPNRTGIYGGSYGGFITLMAMFTQPGVFQAGAALRPVTDWAHYNHGYTSNILNTPQTDLEAYRRSSPIYFADGLKGALLICHGMVDTNVHFQDSVRLAQRLIELRKENWELAVYPVEDHAFVQPTSWADEYKRILKLFETNLKPR